jgi:SAM-dependent methyltransferase
MMSNDIRAQAAKYYDLCPDMPADVPFYSTLIPSPETRVLELGCGTGRVLVPLAGVCGYIHGLDLSEAMIDVCRAKLEAAGVPATRARAEVSDITNFALNQTFDLIIAPYRVLQNLEADAAVDGLFRCIRQQLAPGGSCILNVFRPKRDPEAMRRVWCSDEERFSWEAAVEGGRVTCYERWLRMDPEKMVLYPELIYRRYAGNALVDEAVLKIAMRCYYPEQFEKLIIGQGFRVVQQWGGYNGEPYGQGPELVVQFSPVNRSSLESP